MPGNEDKNDKPAGNEAQEIFCDNNIMGRKMRRGESRSQRAGQHVEIHRDEQTAEKNPPGISGGKQHKSQKGSRCEQNPVRSRDKYQYPLLNFHLDNTWLPLWRRYRFSERF